MKNSLLICLAGLVLPSQAANAQPPAFEVASVKKANPNGGVRGGCHGIDSVFGAKEVASAPPLGRCVIYDGRLSHLILRAWDLKSIDLIKGASPWMISGYERYTIEAKAEDPANATEAQLIAMLQGALVERFNLKFHRETVERSGFSLVVARNGPKLTPAKGDETSRDFGGPKKCCGPNEPVNLTLRKYSIAGLAELLTNIGRRGPIIDKTGLTGQYDFKLSWDETNGPVLITAVQQQLGLRLEAAKVPMQLFVVESAQKPAEN